MNILQAERVELALKEIGLPVKVEYKGKEWRATLTWHIVDRVQREHPPTLPVSVTGASSVSMIDAIEGAIQGYRNRK